MSAPLKSSLYYDGEMFYPTPRYTKGEVDRAGSFLAAIEHPTQIPSEQHLMDAFDKVNNWRSSHGYPINTFQATLRAKASRVDSGPIIAQRLKRYESIMAKLRRNPQMSLSRMQDIGGLRAVVRTVSQARELAGSYVNLKHRSFQHQLVKQQDYVNQPKTSGYRSIHLIYKYRNEKAEDYNGLQIEMQIRSRLQHSWATAVETLGTFLQQSLKASEGEERWLRLFALISSGFAHVEGEPAVPGYERMTKRETYDAALAESERLNLRQSLEGFTVAADHINAGRFIPPGQTAQSVARTYHLIILNTAERKLRISAFSRDNLAEANEKYAEIEQSILAGAPLQAVLVAAGSIRDLRKAYPNYFLDSRDFIRQLDALRSLS